MHKGLFSLYYTFMLISFMWVECISFVSESTVLLKCLIVTSTILGRIHTRCNSFACNKITLQYFSDQCLLSEVICQDTSTCCVYEDLLDTELSG